MVSDIAGKIAWDSGLLPCKSTWIGQTSGAFMADLFQTIVSLLKEGSDFVFRLADTRGMLLFWVLLFFVTQIVIILLLLRNIRRRFRAERKLKEREKYLDTILDSIQEGVMLVDQRATICRVNPILARLLNKAENDLIGCDFRQVIPLDSVTSQQFQEFPISPSSNVLRFENANGEVRHIQILITPLRHLDQASSYFILVFHDITLERQQAERERQHHHMEAMARMAGMISHDFKNIFNGIIGAAEILAMNPSKEDTERYSELIIRTSERASEMLGKLLLFSNIDELPQKREDIHIILDDAITLLRRTVPPAISIITDFKAWQRTIDCEPAELQNAFLNLGLNARDAMPEGGTLTITTRNVTISPGNPLVALHNIVPGDWIEIKITDTGKGVPPSIQDKIFEPYFTTKPRSKGSGLGLAAVYGTIKRHGGYIFLESSIGSGSTFTCLFPLCSKADSALRAADLPAPKLGKDVTAAPVRPQQSILLAEDDPVAAEIARKILECAGYDVMCVDNGIDAIYSFKKHRDQLDLVILDQILPGCDGRQCVTFIRQYSMDIPIIMATGCSPHCHGLKDLSLENTFILAKPYTRQRLLQLVQEASSQGITTH